jgi:hypothetical protein
MPPKTVVMDSSRHIHLMHLIGLSADNLKDIHEMFQCTLTAICGHLR